jgi:hypothetical protein
MGHRSDACVGCSPNPIALHLSRFDTTETNGDRRFRDAWRP